MSYCRWSNDDYQCDVYCYADVSYGYVVHVARNRPVFNEPLPPPETDTRKWFERHQTVSEMMRRATHRKIGLEYDGETFATGTAVEMAETLEMLRGKGYMVPQYAIDALREEAKEEGV